MKNEKISGYIFCCGDCGKRIFAQVTTMKSGKVKRLEPLCKVEHRGIYTFCPDCGKEWDRIEKELEFHF